MVGPRAQFYRYRRGSPSSYQASYLLTCPKCNYQLPKPVRIEDRGMVFLCLICGNGRNTEVTDENCLRTTYPQIADELDDDTMVRLLEG